MLPYNSYCSFSSSSLPRAQGGENILREPDVNMTNSLTGLVEEQHSVGSSLLDHLCVGVVTVRPGVGVFVVSVGDQARKVRLLVAGSGIVEGEEGGRHGSDRNEETRLHSSISFLLSASPCAHAPVVSRVFTYAEALGARRGVVGVTGAVAGVTALYLGSYTTRGAQGCSLKG